MSDYKIFSIGEVFDISTPKKKFNANTVKFGGKHRYVARGESNNGIRGYITESEEYLNPANTISFGQDTATMFYQNAPYFTGDKIKIFTLKGAELTREISIYLIATMKKSFVTFGWGKSSFNVNVLKAVNVALPVTAEGKIDFAYMERCIRELEAPRIRELDAYLKVTGFTDVRLTADDQQFLSDYYVGEKRYGAFRLGDLFVWQPQTEIRPLDIEKYEVENGKLYPFYGQSTINNGIISFLSLTDKVLNNNNGKPTILIHSNNQNTVYLESPFYLKDGHGATSVLQADFLNRETALFLISCIRKVITSVFSYNEKATKIALKSTIIQLPIDDNGSPDYDYMSRFIRIQQKLAIKNVADWKEKEITACRMAVVN